MSRLQYDGELKRMPPKNCGVIGNGHAIKPGRDGQPSVWDESFEREFQKADDNFPKVINWLKSLPSEDRGGLAAAERWAACDAPDEMLGHLVEGIVSLVVRSPRTRETAVSLAEHLRGQLPERERNVLIGSNLKGVQRAIVQNIGNGGKVGILHSPEREFIFGDGFFHTLIATRNPQLSPHILAPLTPDIAVLLAHPAEGFMIEPPVAVLRVSRVEADLLNDAVLAYSRRWIFFRSEAPEVSDAFKTGRHLRYSDANHPIDRLARSMPGVSPRDASFDAFARMIEAQQTS